MINLINLKKLNCLEKKKLNKLILFENSLILDLKKITLPFSNFYNAFLQESESLLKINNEFSLSKKKWFNFFSIFSILKILKYLTINRIRLTKSLIVLINRRFFNSNLLSNFKIKIKVFIKTLKIKNKFENIYVKQKELKKQMSNPLEQLANPNNKLLIFKKQKYIKFRNPKNYFSIYRFDNFFYIRKLVFNEKTNIIKILGSVNKPKKILISKDIKNLETINKNEFKIFKKKIKS